MGLKKNYFFLFTQYIFPLCRKIFLKSLFFSVHAIYFPKKSKNTFKNFQIFLFMRYIFSVVLPKLFGHAKNLPKVFRNYLLIEI